jgi:hypothetical protein
MALHIHQKTTEGRQADFLKRVAVEADAFAVPGNDIAALFSYFSGTPQSRRSSGWVYRELVREEAALAAAGRWPLLAEIEGLEPHR